MFCAIFTTSGGPVKIVVTSALRLLQRSDSIGDCTFTDYCQVLGSSKYLLLRDCLTLDRGWSGSLGCRSHLYGSDGLGRRCGSLARGQISHVLSGAPDSADDDTSNRTNCILISR